MWMAGKDEMTLEIEIEVEGDAPTESEAKKAMESNLAKIKQDLNKNGWTVVSIVTSGHFYLLPATRWRIILVCARHRKLILPQAEVERKLNRVRDVVVQIGKNLKNRMLPLERVMLPEEHPIVQEQKAVLTQKWENAVRNGDIEHGIHEKEIPYLEKMRALFAACGVEWVQPANFAPYKCGLAGISNLEPDNVFYTTLPYREKLVLKLIEEAYPYTKDVVCTSVISRSAERASKCRPRVGITGCVKPLDKVWLHWLQRPMLAEEKMALQGWQYGSYDAKHISKNELANMAGNAIPIPLVMAVDFAFMSDFGGDSNSN